MNKEEIEELAFKDRKELANLNELDLLEIIEFLQLDRKQWINQYSTAHNDYVDLQQENKKQKEVIDKLVEILNYNSKTKKEVILGQVKGLLKYIRKEKRE